jgi:hypothetical protein
MESDRYTFVAYAESSTTGQQSVHTSAGKACTCGSESFSYGWTELG